MLATWSSDKTVRLWSSLPKTGLEPAVLRHTQAIKCVAFSPDGARLATACSDATARLWDAATGIELAVLEGHKSGVDAVAFSPDGLQLATGSSDATVRLWDAATGRERAVLAGHKSGIESIAFNRDGSQLATASLDGTSRLWDAATGKELAGLTTEYGNPRSVCFCPDGRLLAAHEFDELSLVSELVTGKTLASKFSGGWSHLLSLAVSQDGSRFMTGSSDRTASVWNAAKGEELAVLEGHEGEVRSVAFSPDGTRLATASADRTVRLWDLATGNELAVLKGHTGEVMSLAVCPDGTRLVSGSTDNTARLWGLSNADIHANRVAAAAAKKQLKPMVDEWFAGDGDEAAVTQKLAAAKGTLPAADWREAANLVLIESAIRRERAKLKRLAAARDRFSPQVDEWFAGITTPNFESVDAHLRAKQSELSAEDFSVLDGLCQERAAATTQKFWQSVLSSTPEGLAFFTDAVQSANDNAGMLNELAWGVKVQLSGGANVSPELLAAAVAAARRGVELRPDEFYVLDTLAHLLARQGHLDEAIATQRIAVERATDEQRPAVAAFLAELEAKAEAAKAPLAEKAEEPATEAAAPAAEEPAPDGGPVGQPADAATESPIEPAPSAL